MQKDHHCLTTGLEYLLCGPQSEVIALQWNTSTANERSNIFIPLYFDNGVFFSNKVSVDYRLRSMSTNESEQLSFS